MTRPCENEPEDTHEFRISGFGPPAMGEKRALPETLSVTFGPEKKDFAIYRLEQAKATGAKP